MSGDVPVMSCRKSLKTVPTFGFVARGGPHMEEKKLRTYRTREQPNTICKRPTPL